jgi:hypothetical protein
MNYQRSILIPILILASSLGAGFLAAQLRISRIYDTQTSLTTSKLEAVAAIQAAKQEAIADLKQMTATQLKEFAADVTRGEIESFERKIETLRESVDEKDRELAQKRTAIDRLDQGLPELVDLDALGEYYDRKIKVDSPEFSRVESFRTAAGVLAFAKKDIQVIRASKSREVILVRIGKKDTSESAELIGAWLAESEGAKTKLGYVRQFKKERPADYGEITETLFHKKDMYFRTYFQFERVQGTYDRHSFEYTYFVEIGSRSRRERYELSQYNRKLGS